MRLFYLNCLQRVLLFISILLTTGVINVIYSLTTYEQESKSDTFDLPEIVSIEDNTQTKTFVVPMDTYKVVWTRQLRADLNPPKIEIPKPPPKPPEPKLPALAGIIFEPENSFVLFANEGGKILLKKENQIINEFIVARILPDAVELIFKEKKYELKMPKKEPR